MFGNFCVYGNEVALVLHGIRRKDPVIQGATLGDVLLRRATQIVSKDKPPESNGVTLIRDPMELYLKCPP